MEVEELIKEMDFELKAIIKHASNGILERYVQVRNCYLTTYSLSEIDPIRDEICRCIVFGLNQAAITLTNNLLEKGLKALLINDELRKLIPQGMSHENIESAFKKPIEDFSGKSMEQTINACATRNIITKTQKMQLKEFKNKIRDSFSHGVIERIVGERTVPLAIGTLSNPTDIKHFELKINSLPFIEGIVQVEISNQLAIPYFKSVDNVIRAGIHKIYGDEIPDVRIKTN